MNWCQLEDDISVGWTNADFLSRMISSPRARKTGLDDSTTISDKFRHSWILYIVKSYCIVSVPVICFRFSVFITRCVFRDGGAQFYHLFRKTCSVWKTRITRPYRGTLLRLLRNNFKHVRCRPWTPTQRVWFYCYSIKKLFLQRPHLHPRDANYLEFNTVTTRFGDSFSRAQVRDEFFDYLW